MTVANYIRSNTSGKSNDSGVDLQKSRKHSRYTVYLHSIIWVQHRIPGPYVFFRTLLWSYAASHIIKAQRYLNNGNQDHLDTLL